MTDAADTGLMGYTPTEFAAFQAGYLSGSLAGIERGRELADREAAALYRGAAWTVHAMANIQPYAEHRRAVRERTLQAAQRRRDEARDEFWAAP